MAIEPTTPQNRSDRVDERAGVLMRHWRVEDTDESAYDLAVAEIRALEAAGYRIVDGALLDELHAVSDQLREG